MRALSEINSFKMAKKLFSRFSSTLLFFFQFATAAAIHSRKGKKSFDSTLNWNCHHNLHSSLSSFRLPPPANVYNKKPREERKSIGKYQRFHFYRENREIKYMSWWRLSFSVVGFWVKSIEESVGPVACCFRSFWFLVKCDFYLKITQHIHMTLKWQKSRIEIKWQ